MKIRSSPTCKSQQEETLVCMCKLGNRKCGAVWRLAFSVFNYMPMTRTILLNPILTLLNSRRKNSCHMHHQ